MMKVLQNVEIIMIGSEVYYNYNGTLYTHEQFRETYFPKIDISSNKEGKTELDIFDGDEHANMINIKLQVGDYVSYSICNENDTWIDGEGVIVKAKYDEDDDHTCDCYVVKTGEDITDEVIIYGRDVDEAWR